LITFDNNALAFTVSFALLQVMKDNGDAGFYNTNKVAFNSYNKMFERFGRDDE